MYFQCPKRTFFAGTMIISGSICAVIALASWFYCWNFIRTASHADGRVTQLLQRYDKENDLLYAPVFVFRDAQGAEHTVYSSMASYPPMQQVGDSVHVLYSPDDPSHAKIDSFFSLWGWPFVTGQLAAFGLTIGLVIWFWPRIVRRFRPASPVSHAA